MALAVFDLVTGLFGCAGSLCFHSYYLWCAVNVDRCQYEVELIQYSNNGQIMLVMGTLQWLHTWLWWSVYLCSMHMTWIMSIERYFAICKPLKHKIYFSVSKIRTFIILLILLMVIQTIGLKLLLEPTQLKWKVFYKPDFKFYAMQNSNKENKFYQGIYEITSITINFTLSITFTSIVRWKLQRRKKSEIKLTTLNQSPSSKTMNNNKTEIPVVEQNPRECESQDVTPNSDKSSCTKQNAMPAVLITPGTPKLRSTNSIQQESVLDMAITHTWFIGLEVTTFFANSSVIFYASKTERSKDGAPHGTVLYAAFWFAMSSSFFNFLLYNIRIPAFRKASWELITSVRKVAKLWKK